MKGLVGDERLCLSFRILGGMVSGDVHCLRYGNKCLFWEKFRSPVFDKLGLRY